MKIIVDAREYGQLNGKGRYVTQIIDRLIEIDQGNQYVFLIDKKNKKKSFKNYRWKLISGFYYWKMFLFLKKETNSLFFSPTSYISTIFSPVQSIQVVHDLAIFVCKKTQPTFKTRIIESIFARQAFKKASHLIAVSKNTKQDIMDVFKVDEKKISVTYLAPFGENENGSSKSSYDFPKEFVLFVGTIEPRKNIINLIKGYQKLSADLKEKYPLLIVGKRGWNSNETTALLDSLKGKENIKEYNSISDSQLNELYKRAIAFIYPSWYEGFGLPVLEAMRFGLPIITSNNSSLKEISKDVGILIDPGSPKEISQALTDIMTKPNVRENLSKASLNKSEEFSWKKTAIKTLEIIRGIQK